MRDAYGRRVALHSLPPGLHAAGPELVGLRADLARLAGLHHPAIPPAEVVEVEGRLAIATAWGPGSDLGARRQGLVPPGPLLEIVEQVADALHVAWSELGIVHGDLRPRHLRIGTHGTVELHDLGLARLLPPDRHAPRDVGQPSSDVFALGCVLFEAWTGNPFFGGPEGPRRLGPADTAATTRAFLEERLARPSLRPVTELLRAMLAFHPESRPTAAIVAQRCEEIASRLPERLTLRRWSRDRRDESQATERVATVESGPIERRPLDDGADEPTSVTLPTLASVPQGLGPETPPAPLPSVGEVLRPGPIDPRPAPLPPLPPSAGSQATTRWMTPVAFDDDVDARRSRSTSDLVLIGTFVVAGGGLALTAIWLAGVFDALPP